MAMKKKIKIALIVFGAVVFVWYGYVGAVKYKNWKWYRGMKNEAAKFEAEITDKKAKIAADTYGGKTPQETLDLFISAVEKSDYELASKYFVVEKQKEWNKNLEEVENDNIEFLIKTLNNIKGREGYFSKDNMIYTIEDPVFVQLKLYPSNLWKIDEI